MNSPHTAFIEDAYQETYTLLVEVRDYVTGTLAGDGKALSPENRVTLMRELTRVTRRLTETMAWLLIRKAVDVGEITEQAARGQAAANLGPDEDGADGTPGDLGRLPLAARGLIDRSRRLYARIETLRDGLEGENN